MPVLQGVEYLESDSAQFTIARNGTLAYIPGSATRLNNTLAMVDRAGREEPLKAPARAYEDMALSPDGRFLALTLVSGQQWNIWLYDLQQGSLSRLTFEGDNRDPLWSTDGKHVIYASTRKGRRGIYWKAVGGSGGEEQLLETKTQPFPTTVSADGKYLLYGVGSWEDTAAIYALPLEGERKPKELFKERGVERAMASPDGKWIAYESSESGRVEIYVRRFSGGGQRWQISPDGGTHAVWSKDGRELYFRSTGGDSGGNLMSAMIAKNDEFTFSAARSLFRFSYAQAGHDYEVVGNGQKFIVIKVPENETKATQVNVVLNWASELKRK